MPGKAANDGSGSKRICGHSEGAGEDFRMKRTTKAMPETHYVEVRYLRTRHHKTLAISRALYPYLKGTLKGEQMELAFQIAGEELCPAN